MRDIDLSEWTEFAAGGEAKNYYHNTDDSIMLKLYFQNNSAAKSKADFAMSEAVDKLGIKTPKAREIVTAQGRSGIIYDRLKDKKSMARIIADSPERLEECANVFAETMKIIHSKPADKTIMPSKRDSVKQMSALALKLGYLTHSQYNKLKKTIEAVPVKETCLFGDPNPGNVVYSDGELYIIDLGTFSYGNPVFDMALIYGPVNGAISPETTMKNLHFDFETRVKFTDLVFKKYYESHGETEVNVFLERIKPLAGIIPLSMAVRMGKSQITDERIRKFLGE